MNYKHQDQRVREAVLETITQMLSDDEFAMLSNEAMDLFSVMIEDYLVRYDLKLPHDVFHRLKVIALTELEGMLANTALEPGMVRTCERQVVQFSVEAGR